MNARPAVFDQHPSRVVSELSRRTALGHLGAGLAASLGFVTTIHRAAAQDGTPIADAPAFLDAWLVTWTQDPSRADGLYADDAVLEDMGTGIRYEGRDAVRGHVEEVAVGFPDRRYEVRSAFSTGDLAAVEYVLDAAYTGALPGMPTGSGQPVRVPAVAIITLSGDMIQREAHYYDAYGFLIQLGVLPAPGMEGTPNP